MMKKLLKQLSYVGMLSLTFTTIQAQDTSAFLHLQFENNLIASTTESGGVLFEANDPTSTNFNVLYSNTNVKEGSYSLDFSSIIEDSADENLIQNNVAADIRTTTNFGITGSNPRTISAWIRYDNKNPDTNGSHCIMNMGDPVSATGGRVTFSLAAANDKLQVAIGGGNTNHDYNASVVEDGNWHQVAFTYPSGGGMADIKFYIDGQLVSNNGGTNTANPFNTTSAELVIGSRGNNSQKWFDGGGIDDFRIYDSVLTDAEITTIFNGGTLNTKDISFAKNELTAFPTIVDDILQIQTTSNDSLEINIIDISGKMVIKTSGNSVDMSALTSGLYIVKVREGNKTANLKVIKK